MESIVLQVKHWHRSTESESWCEAIVVVCELISITLANGQQPQEPSRSWQQVVSSGHSDSSSGQMTAFKLPLSWIHHVTGIKAHKQKQLIQCLLDKKELVQQI